MGKTDQNNGGNRSKPLLSPLRYPGSKRELVGYIRSALLLNKIRPTLYIEPFVGGGSIALQLMQDNLVEKVILMDKDPWIASFWKTVFFDTDWLVDKIRNVDVTLNKWHKIKFSNPTTIREKAFTCFFLNRTSFSGILEAKVGPIGGKSQKSEYKIDCRFMKEVLIKRIERASLLKNKVIGVWSCSWDNGIKRIKMEQKEGRLPKSNIFYYFDPPFFKEAESLYRFYFLEEDHRDLHNQVIKIKNKWILSYDSAKQVRELYGKEIKKGTNGTNHHHVQLFYTLAGISKRKRGEEVIISNMDRLPKNGW
jgi:DNA adenine methylase